LVANCGGSGDLGVFSVDEQPTVAARPTISPHLANPRFIYFNYSVRHWAAPVYTVCGIVATPLSQRWN
jgi:hypothetical protein